MEREREEREERERERERERVLYGGGGSDNNGARVNNVIQIKLRAYGDTEVGYEQNDRKA